MTSQQIWEKLYQKKYGNKYPYGDLASYILRLYNKNLDKSRIKVLEVGSGTGNNLWFFAKEGFGTYGIDFSASACQNAKKLLKSNNLKADITIGNFCQLPYQNNFFDLILDRCALYCLKKKNLTKACAEIKRTLKKGGRFLSFMYSTDNECIKYGHPDKLEKNTYTNFKTGTFKNTGITHFVTKHEIINELYRGFKIEYMQKISKDFICPKKYNEIKIIITSGIKK